MSGYVRSTKFEGEFEGEKVTCTLAPLSQPDLLRLNRSEVADDNDAAKVLLEVVPPYVKDWAGPKDADGGEVSVVEVFQAAYFIELALAIGRKLVEASQPPSKPSVPSAS